jgi:hypothetical protein
MTDSSIQSHNFLGTNFLQEHVHIFYNKLSITYCYGDLFCPYTVTDCWLRARLTAKLMPCACVTSTICFLHMIGSESSAVNAADLLPSAVKSGGTRASFIKDDCVITYDISALAGVDIKDLLDMDQLHGIINYCQHSLICVCAIIPGAHTKPRQEPWGGTTVEWMCSSYGKCVLS